MGSLAAHDRSGRYAAAHPRATRNKRTGPRPHQHRRGTTPLRPARFGDAIIVDEGSVDEAASASWAPTSAPQSGNAVLMGAGGYIKDILFLDSGGARNDGTRLDSG